MKESAEKCNGTWYLPLMKKFFALSSFNEKHFSAHFAPVQMTIFHGRRERFLVRKLPTDDDELHNHLIHNN